VRKLVMLAMAAVVALLIVVPTAMAQLPTTGGQAELPTTGGPSLLLPAGALLLGSGILGLGWTVLRRRSSS
jgi:hypothetical protein